MAREYLASDKFTKNIQKLGLPCLAFDELSEGMRYCHEKLQHGIGRKIERGGKLLVRVQRPFGVDLEDRQKVIRVEFL
jgi:hypothetical protein